MFCIIRRVEIIEFGIWDFYKAFHDKELEVAFSFLDFIQSWIPRGVGCDSSHWYLNRNGKFDIWSNYNKIRGASIPSFPWKDIWKVKGS